MRIGQGRENAKQYMKDNPAIAEELSEKIKTQLLSSPASFALTDDMVSDNDE
jgi:recombination protein RecA